MAALIRTIQPDLRNLQILTEAGLPYLYAELSNRAIRASLSGDGVQALLRTACELLTARKTVLLEEPEAHQHPASLLQIASLIVETARRGIQVIATTHSAEFIDDVLSICTLDELANPEFCAVIRTRLSNDGELQTTRIEGKSAEEARAVINEDLR